MEEELFAHFFFQTANAVDSVFVHWFSKFGESKWCGSGLVWFVEFWIKTGSQLHTMCSCIRTEQFPKKSCSNNQFPQIVNSVTVGRK